LHGGKSIEGSEQRPHPDWCNSKVPQTKFPARYDMPALKNKARIAHRRS
jgi:hypothetical protein